jgi:hypothetical protein
MVNKKQNANYIKVLLADLQRGTRAEPTADGAPTSQTKFHKGKHKGRENNLDRHTPTLQSTTDCIHSQDYSNSGKMVRGSRTNSRRGEEVFSTDGILNGSTRLTGRSLYEI